ncbi:MAG: hypothetical protein JSW66_10105 [Phycisphaerales bacterium]|nr:MAG: hypothetical protein JSW66_10105 [Phycisphaerales bacterium]
MIEQALRKRLQPIVKRRRRLYLAFRLSACWLGAALTGIGLLAIDWLWGWKSSFANSALCVTTVLATAVVLYRSFRIGPDYKAVARDIERRHPDLRALLLAAVEQEPQEPDGQFGYLQERVIGEAVRHAVRHDWLRSVSSAKLVSAQLGGLIVLLFLAAAFSHLLPSIPAFFGTNGFVLPRRDYHVAVSPGDTRVESGTPVVILARFNELVPSEVSLQFGPVDEQVQEIVLTRNLEDPVFGGIIQQVNQDLLYHIEYEGRRTRDFRISVYENPVLIRADARITYPPFAKLPEKVIKDTRQINTVEGSRVALTFILNKAVTTAQLLPKEGSALELTVDTEHPNVYTASLITNQSQRYELQLTDAQGLTNEVPQRFSIDVHKNLPPELKPVFPNRDVVASALEELSLEAKVSDDYGVTGYGLSYALAGTESKEIALGPVVESSENQQMQYVLALEELDAKPDQLLTYYFWADDVGPDGQTRRTSGDMYFTEIRPFEEVFREGQSSQDQRNQQNQDGQQQGGQQDEQLARLQKQIISATWNIKRQVDQSGSMDDRKEDLDVVRQSQADVLQKAQSALTEAGEPSQISALQSAAEHMKTSLDHLSGAAESASSTELTSALASEQSAYQELLKLKQNERQVGRGRSSSGNSTARSARSEQQLQQLELRQQENRYETERLAQSQQQASQREDLQVLNRLRELARRQNEMSEKLKEAEAALRQARTEQEREQIRRELKRLRQEQIEALRDVDELQQRMESDQNRRRMAEAREQLGQTRSRIRQSAEELETQMVSRAITSTTRAQRELEQMRDEFRRNTSSQFTDQMRDMREKARQLDQRQKEIAEEIEQRINAKQKTLTDSGVSRELAGQMDQQRENVNELVGEMRDVSEQAESSEPLLSRKLYDTLRKTSTGNVDRALEVTSQLLRRNFLPQAREIERQAGKGVEQLKEGIEDAAKSVLGDEAESLRLARQQIDELIRQVDQEVARAGRAGPADSDPNASQSRAGGEQQRADSQARTGQGRGGDPNSPREADANRQLSDDRARAGREQTGTRRAGGPADPTGWGGNRATAGQWEQFDPNGPLTGRNFPQWSDRLRDVEEMLNEPDFRNEVAGVRDRARAMRAEFTRHGKEPQWDLVRQQITRPLTELRNRISEELAQLQSDEAIVPIDRDPVPGRFAELVRRYYENLGGDE